MTRLAVTAALVAVALVVGAASSWAVRSVRPWSVPAGQVQVVACQVSWNSYTRKPTLLKSSRKPCDGMWRVAIDAKGRIALKHTGNPVIGIRVTANETTVGRGITAGASGGSSTTDLTVHDARLGRALNLTRAADARRLGQGAGFWVALTHDDR